MIGCAILKLKTMETELSELYEKYDKVKKELQELIINRIIKIETTNK